MKKFIFGLIAVAIVFVTSGVGYASDAATKNKSTMIVTEKMEIGMAEMSYDFYYQTSVDLTEATMIIYESGGGGLSENIKVHPGYDHSFIYADECKVPIYWSRSFIRIRKWKDENKKECLASLCRGPPEYLGCNSITLNHG